MSHRHEFSTSEHVAITMAHIEERMRLRDLVALTRGLAPPGAASLELVLPILRGPKGVDWRLLHGVPASIVTEIAAEAVDLFEKVRDWGLTQVGRAVQQVSCPKKRDPDTASRVLKVMLLGYVAPFCLEEALAILGKDDVVARLRIAANDFHAANLIG